MSVKIPKDITAADAKKAWSALNNWKWPVEHLGNPPDGWRLEGKDNKRELVHALQRQLEAIAGGRAECVDEFMRGGRQEIKT